MPKIMKLPDPYVDVMVTYKNKKGEIVTKMGFYCSLFNEFSVPPSYMFFKGRLLPNGWGGDHLPVKKVKKWEPINDAQKVY